MSERHTDAAGAPDVGDDTLPGFRHEGRCCPFLPEHIAAAAVPVPDTGDDTLRLALARELFIQNGLGGVAGNFQAREDLERAWDAPGDGGRQSWLNKADALLPLVREHIARATLHCPCGGSIDVPGEAKWIQVVDNWRFNHRHHGNGSESP